MKKEKVKKLAESFSSSCKKIMKDRQLMQTLTSSSGMLVSLTVIHLITLYEEKSHWG